MKSGLQKDKAFTALCEGASAQGWSVPTSVTVNSMRDFGKLRTHTGTVGRLLRILQLLAVLSGAILADVACVKNVRTANDNFYVINPKRSSSVRSVVPDLVHPSTSVDEASKSQADSGPRPKSVLSNLGILEEENSTISSLLRK